MTFDEKLDDILLDYLNHMREAVAIEQIKQAFADEGYMKPEYMVVDEGKHPEIQFEKVMTGQEFFDRFDEITDALLDFKKSLTDIEYMEAAKKAAGII